MKRNPAVAGMFYPGNPKTLSNIVRRFLDEAEDFDLPDLKALICPHAGYPYSGPTAGFCYRQLEKMKKKPATYILIGPSHQAYIEASVGNFESYETPLGKVKVNRGIASEIEKEMDFIPDAHASEHCLEVQLPFLQTIDPKAQIVPILCGSISPDRLAEILEPYFDKPDIFFIVSSDLSHYLPYEEAVLRDKNSLRAIEFKDIENEDQIDACGQTGVKTIMRLADKHGLNIKLLDYRNSGDTAGDKSGVVGYGALAIYK